MKVYSEFTLENVQTISPEKAFIAEFLYLSNIAMSEARNIIIDAIKHRNLKSYRQIAHKIKTNLKMLGLYQLETLISNGKDLFISEDDRAMQQFADVLILNFDYVIEKINMLLEEYK